MKKILMTVAIAAMMVGTAQANEVDPDVWSRMQQYRIDGEFKGWEGESIYKLTDGHVIQQSSYHYHYHYSYSPQVVFYRDGCLKIHVMGDNDSDTSDDVCVVVLN